MEGNIMVLNLIVGLVCWLAGFWSGRASKRIYRKRTIKKAKPLIATVEPAGGPNIYKVAQKRKPKAKTDQELWEKELSNGKGEH
jgi:hypothetical protein